MHANACTYDLVYPYNFLTQIHTMAIDIQAGGGPFGLPYTAQIRTYGTVLAGIGSASGLSMPMQAIFRGGRATKQQASKM